MALTTPNTAAKTEAPAEEAQETMSEEGVAATAQEPKAEEPEAKAQSAAVAKPESKAMATSDSRNSIEKSMAEEGFDGLNVGGMSFDRIKLGNEGQFLMGQNDVELGKQVDVVIQNTRSLYIVRQSPDQDADLYYSYDPNGLTGTEGQDKKDTLQEWKEEGFDNIEIKKYLEAMAILLDPENPDRDRSMVMLSVPPASVQRLSGFFAQQAMMKKQKPYDFVTRLVVGDKIKKDGNSWFPWNFKNAGPAPEDLF